MDKSPEEIVKKPYARILIPDENGGFSAEILEFPGCFAEGETPNEALEALEKAARAWVQAALDQGQEIPEPFSNQGYGGKIALRLPRSIHRQAARMAERDNTSLNQFLLAAISTRVGAEEVYSRIAERLEQRLAFTAKNLAVGVTSYLGNLDFQNIEINFIQQVGSASTLIGSKKHATTVSATRLKLS